MLYFISSDAGIKIGISDSILSRLATINTSSPHPCKVVLALEVPNQKQVEDRLHEALAQHRKNGEWFEVSFAKAFQALVELNVISDPFPKLDLLYPDRIVPEMDQDFPNWWMSVNGLSEAHQKDVQRAWREDREEFLEYRNENLPFQEMVFRGKALRKQIEDEFSELKNRLRSERP